jgi:hypothetical protein
MDPWSQMGFIYRNVPPFNLAPGRPVSFDLGLPNDSDIQLDIELALAANGTQAPIGPFTKIVSNTQTAAAPRGNAVVGDYELSFSAQTQFTFPGGGLIVRFSNPFGSHAEDVTCDQVMVGGSAADASGMFLGRFYSDPDGLPPYAAEDDDDIAAVRFSDAPPTRCAGREVTIIGTLGADTLVGTKGADVIAVLAGNDTVRAGGGKDVVCGGPGKDRLFGQGGKDRLLGEGGKDLLRGGRGKDKVKGGAGKDSERQ